jgi:hypothetical protein
VHPNSISRINDLLKIEASTIAGIASQGPILQNSIPAKNFSD